MGNSGGVSNQAGKLKVVTDGATVTVSQVVHGVGGNTIITDIDDWASQVDSLPSSFTGGSGINSLYDPIPFNLSDYNVLLNIMTKILQ